jgi:uncharacterized protein DUF11
MNSFHISKRHNFVALVVTPIAFALASAAQAQQAVESADVNITSVQTSINAKNEFVCTATINNRNDDAARNAKVIVLLPLQVKVRTAFVLQGPACRKVPHIPNNGNYHGYVICDLGQLPQGPTVTRTIKVTTSRSTALPTYPETCSALIFSDVGDIDKKNNYQVAPYP